MKTLLIAAAIGAISIGGIAYAAQQTPPAPMSPAPKPMMPRADANGDGAISRDEFMAQQAQRFDRIDANKDGRIDTTERQAMRAQMGGRGQGMGRRGMRNQGMDGMPPPPPPAAVDDNL